MDLVAPEIAGQAHLERHAPLGKAAIPLGPGGLFLLSEIEGGDHVAALPAAVRRRVCIAQRVAAVRQVPPPDPADRRHRLGERSVLERGDHAGNAATSAALPAWSPRQRPLRSPNRCRRSAGSGGGTCRTAATRCAMQTRRLTAAGSAATWSPPSISLRRKRPPGPSGIAALPRGACLSRWACPAISCATR